MFLKNYVHWKQFTFNSPPYLPTLERIMALQQMTDEKNTFRLFSHVLFRNSCVQFLPKALNFVLGTLKIVSLQTKFEKWRIHLRSDPHKQTNLELSFEPSKLKTLWWQFLSWKSLSALETINSWKTHQYLVDILCNWLSPSASFANWKVRGY